MEIPSHVPAADGRSLRDRLRDDTRAEHDRLDALLLEAALSEDAGIAAFLAAHAGAFGALGPAVAGSGDRALADMTAELSGRLAADLAAMGGDRGEAPVPAAPERLSPLALSYVLLGARLGARAIARQRAGPGRRRTRPLAFLEAPETPGAWRALLATLSGLPATGAEADRTVADARTVFAVFEAAARAALRVPA